MGPLSQIQSLLQANNSVEALQEQCTPFFQSGVVLPRDSWSGSLIAWGWKVASLCGFSDEKKELMKILSASHRAFRIIQQKDFQTQDVLARSYSTLSYFPEHVAKIERSACNTLNCPLKEWRRAMRAAQRHYCLDLLDELTFSATARPVLRELVQQTPEGSVLRQRKQWLDEVRPFLSHVPSALLWDCFEKIVEEVKPQAVDEELCCSCAFELVQAGLRLDQIVDRDSPIPNTMLQEPIRLIDERFRCCSLAQNSERMILFAKNGFLIPMWRTYTAQKKTLFKVIDCYAMDESRRMAYVEAVLGSFSKVGVDMPQAFDEFCLAMREWVETHLRFHPKLEDLWISHKGHLVTFSPVYEQGGPFSVIEVERCIHATGLSSARRRELCARIGFFDLVEVRTIEHIWKELDRFSESDIAEALASRGIEDVAVYKAFVRLIEMNPTPEERDRYLQQAHEEGFFYFSSCTQVASRPVVCSRL